MPRAVPEGDREAAMDVHQLRVGHWSRFRQYLHRIGRPPRRHASGVVAGGALPHMPKEADTPEHVLLLEVDFRQLQPVSGWSASQNTRHRLHDTDAAAGRRRRRHLGPRPQTRRNRWLPDGRRKKTTTAALTTRSTATMCTGKAPISSGAQRIS